MDYFYYFLIILAVFMFGGNFAINDAYRKSRGSTVKVSLQFTFIGAIAGLVVLFALNGLKIEFTWFTLMMALLSVINGFLFTFCGFKALGMINLSLYSLFSMLGGMLLPFLQGIIFYNEGITVAKITCLVFICAALLLTVERGEKKKGTIFYIGIFVLNGMSGVISKLYTSAPFEKASASGYSILCAVCSIVVSGIILTLFFKKKDDTPKMTVKNTLLGASGGAINRVANYLLVIALAQVHASVQYPMVTGGVMIVSTLICFFGENKPSKKEMLSVLLAFLGMLALFIIPI